MVATTPQVTERLVRRRAVDVRGTTFRWLLIAALAVTAAILAVLILEMMTEGWAVLSGRLVDFLTSGATATADTSGVWQGIKGTVMLGVIVAVVAFPVGIGAAIYLEEYAKENRMTRLITVNIRNLAGVPSIVYGLLGLAIFVKALSGDGNQGGLTGGRTVISGGLTLAALVLPIVVITAQEAIRAVPQGIREGSLALGSTGWETVRHHVLPVALPGVLTGSVLSLARAAGEAAPLLVVGAQTSFFSTGDNSLFEQVSEGAFTALPMLIFGFARQPSTQGWGHLAAAAGVVLLVMIFVMNGFAIWLRNRSEIRS